MAIRVYDYSVSHFVIGSADVVVCVVVVIAGYAIINVIGYVVIRDKGRL